MKREELDGYPCTEKGRCRQAKQEQGKNFPFRRKGTFFIRSIRSLMICVNQLGEIPH